MLSISYVSSIFFRHSINLLVTGELVRRTRDSMQAAICNLQQIGVDYAD